MKKTAWLSLAFLGVHAWAVAQNPPYTTGLPLEPDPYYDEIPTKVPLTNSNYRDIASKASVKKYAPTPKSQGQYGTCAAWAGGYAARTILEAQRYGWTDKEKITSNVFAYGFLYRITSSSSKCWGAFTSEICKNLRDVGVPKLTDYSTHCPQEEIPEDVYDVAAKYKIKGYAKLWDEQVYKTSKQRVDAMKKSLSEGNPVLISMICPNSFFYPESDVWIPKEKPTDDPNHPHGRHAMCVVGYDDDKHEGAFEIQNSWGDDWGDGGYIWVKYEDFADFVYQAFELWPFENTKPNEDIELAGALKLQLDSGQEMKATWDGNAYKLDKAYRSGTRFRLYISNNEPAYVYAFGSDLTNKTYQVFPHLPNVSPALTYKKNDVAIPDETHHVRMDNNVGTDFLCVLYSKEPLNLEDIQTKYKQQSKSLSVREKLEAVLGSKLMKSTDVTYTDNKISFKGKAKGKSVVALVVETEHIE